MFKPIKRPYSAIERFERDMLTPSVPRLSRAAWLLIGLLVAAVVLTAGILVAMVVAG